MSIDDRNNLVSANQTLWMSIFHSPPPTFIPLTTQIYISMYYLRTELCIKLVSDKNIITLIRKYQICKNGNNVAIIKLQNVYLHKKFMAITNYWFCTFILNLIWLNIKAICILYWWYITEYEKLWITFNLVFKVIK